MTTTTMKLLHSFAAFLCLLLLTSSSSSSSPLSVSAYTITVKPSAEDCYFILVDDEAERVVGSFQVLSGGFLDIDAFVYAPSGKVIYQGERQTSDAFQFFATTAGIHRLCFNNAMSTVSSKTLSFDFDIGRKIAHLDAAKSKQLDPMHQAVMQFGDAFQMVSSKIRYSRSRLIRHAATSSSTSRRLTWSMVMEAISLVVVFGVQAKLLVKFVNSGSNSQNAGSAFTRR
jgi:hypothetical protein